MSTHKICFEQKYEKYQNFYLKIFIFGVVNFSVCLNRHVFVMIYLGGDYREMPSRKIELHFM